MVVVIGSLNAVEYFHKGAFAGAVLANESEHFMGFQDEANVEQHLNAAKGFVDPFHPDGIATHV